MTPNHWRKLLYSKDSYFIDKIGGKVQKGDISFIGEWECCSECTYYKTNNKIFSKRHTPFTTIKDEDVQNVFNEIANRVLAAGFYLGIRMPMPAKREIYNILK